MWGRKKPETTDETVDLDEQVRRLRNVISAGGAAEAVGPLIAVLTARATLASMADKPDVVLEDRRAAAGLLRAYDGQPSPVDRRTDLLVRMGLASAERAEGNLDAAMEAAVWTLDHLGAVEHDDRELCEAFVVDLDAMRSALSRAKRRPDALRAAELASDLATRLAEQDEAGSMTLLGLAWVNEAAARANAGDFDGAQALNEEAITLLEEHAPTFPALTTAIQNRAQMQRRYGEWAEAVLTEQKLLADVRHDRPSSRDEVQRLNTLFITLVRSGRREEAEQTITEAISVARTLVGADPAQASLLATLLGNQANIRGELERHQAALESSEEALGIRERLAATHPSLESDTGLAMILNNHSAVLRRLDRLPEAAACAARSVEVRRRLADAGEPNTVALLANSLNTHAEQLGYLGDTEHAVRLAEEARDLFASLPPPGAVKKYLRANQDTLGRVLAVAGRYDEAVDAAARAVELGREAAAAAPGEIPELASCLESLAEWLTHVGRAGEAASARDEATRLRESVAS